MEYLEIERVFEAVKVDQVLHLELLTGEVKESKTRTGCLEAIGNQPFQSKVVRKDFDPDDHSVVTSITLGCGTKLTRINGIWQQDVADKQWSVAGVWIVT